MVILPAIDLLNGKCVRLYKGKYETSEKVAEDAYLTAQKFIEEGAKWLHVVDLNGAKKGAPENFEIIKKLAKLNINIQSGGGIRDLRTIEKYLDAGIKRIILGSAAVENEEFVKAGIKNFPDKISVGIDAENEIVKTHGWQNSGKVNYIDFAERMEGLGVRTIIFTDISKDGTLQGPNLEQLKKLKDSVKCNIIASGGIKNIEDIKNLKALNVYGAICGKSVYSGTLSLTEALKIAKEG